MVKQMENTYWNTKGAMQAEYDTFVELVPCHGDADTLAGELVRACTRLAYDLYNNGMGNNTSGAVNMLHSKGVITTEQWSTIEPYTRGRLYDGNYSGDKLQCAIEDAITCTMQHLVNNPALLTQANTESMFDYEDEEQHFCEECDEDIGQYGSHLCDSCEQWQLDQEEIDSWEEEVVED